MVLLNAVLLMHFSVEVEIKKDILQTEMKRADGENTKWRHYYERQSKENESYLV